MKTRGNLYMALFFLLLGLSGVVQSVRFQYPESVVLPLALSSLILVCALIETVKELRYRPIAGTTSQPEPALDRLEIQRAALLLGWLGGFFIGIWLLGFWLSIPVFSLAYLKWRKRSWLAAIIFTIIALACLFGIFEILLRGHLYRGLVFGD